MLGNVMKVSELKEILDEFEGDEEIYLLFDDTQTNRIMQLFINKVYSEPDDDSFGSWCVMDIKYYEELEEEQ